MAEPAPSSCASLTLTAAERDLIRRELGVRFGNPPRIADGIHLRRWRGGPQAGQPKLPAAVQSLVERGLLVVQSGTGPFARAFFTEAGLSALHQLAGERRGLDPVQYAHVRQELGLEEADVEELGTIIGPTP
ncbi:hypothetical protein [Teichococcus aestuarii]|uniref:Uncharacterized protein n=1 Tax=Teichococcus aestuarii TaxID=568898 RepID=A0A2U1UYV0_9PROT|nr:hypothetical protein [Pseudoroseomonas aestuarii]PWC26834.1 hypothetical protein CR165_20920 [Pseudoroseomonas aestuarii]